MALTVHSPLSLMDEGPYYRLQADGSNVCIYLLKDQEGHSQFRIGLWNIKEQKDESTTLFHSELYDEAAGCLEYAYSCFAELNFLHPDFAEEVESHYEAICNHLREEEDRRGLSIKA